MIQLGAGPLADFSDPLAMLSDCHRRVERFLDGLLAVAEQARGGELTANQREALDLGLRYFGGMGAKHNADEEESLFPRLRASGRADLQAVLGRVAVLEEEHVRAGTAHAEVDELGRRWLEGGRLTVEESGRLCGVLAELAELYRGHIAVEDGELFPAAAAALSVEERKAMGAEMAARRAVNIEGGQK